MLKVTGNACFRSDGNACSKIVVLTVVRRARDIAVRSTLHRRDFIEKDDQLMTEPKKPWEPPVLTRLIPVRSGSAMHLVDSLPKPDIDARLVWATTRLAEYREGSIPFVSACFVWGLLVGWGQSCANAYEGSQYLRIAAYFEKELRNAS